MIAIASVLLVITPISWILLHQPQNDDADASVPIVTRTDDTYITPTTKAAVSTPSARATVPPTAAPTTTPTGTPTVTPTNGPTDTPTDSASPTTVPTRTPSTTAPTSAPTSTAPTTAPTSPGRTTKPTSTPTTTPPPPARDGGMDANELQLFDMIDSARQSNGCAPLEQDPSLTDSARAEAKSRAKSGATNSSSALESTAGGDNWTAQQAYDQMMAQSRSTLMNCGLTTLGVGRRTQKHCTAIDLLGLCIGSNPTRVAWVADFT